MSFEWETQEEISWDEPPSLEAEPIEPPQRRRWWPYILLAIIIGAGTATLIIVRELNQRIAQAEAEARVEVVSSYNVIQQAANENDAELFVGFLSGRDEAWAQAQEEAVREGAFLNRDGLGLRRLDAGNVAEAMSTVTLAPDLLSAELTVTQTYAVDIGNGLTESVPLQQTAVYRLGPNRWLLSPPEPEFWGETQTSSGRYLVMTYPERDAAIGRRLALDLDRKLIEMCAQISGLNCPPTLQLTLDLTTEPDSLLLLSQVQIPTGRSLRLPTPTLTGVPLDEGGYQSLRSGYARWITAAVISDLVGWTCCDHELFYQAILDTQWQQLGLKKMAPVAYAQVQDNASQLEALVNLWAISSDAARAEEKEMVYALIEFLLTEANVPTPGLQREFGDIAFRNWLLNTTEDIYPTFDDLEREWRRFLNERVDDQVQALLSHPVQDLQLLCWPISQTNLNLLRYTSATDSFVFEHTFISSISMVGLPDDSGVFFWGAGLPEPIMWRDGVAKTLPIFADLPALSFSPQGDYLLAVDVLQTTSPYLLLPLTECLIGESCTKQPLAGYPIWSPNGSQVVLVSPDSTDLGQNDPLLFWANDKTGNGAELLSKGTSPFWIDEMTLGLVEQGEVLSLLKLTDASTEVLLTVGDLLTHVPPQESEPNEIFIDFVTVDPYDPARLIIATADRLGRLAHAHLFVYNRETGQVNVPQFFRNEPTDYKRGYELSPDGRWLAMTRFDSDEGLWRLHLYDITQNQTTIFTVEKAFDPTGPRLFDWSADGKWLVVTEKGYVRLIELASGYEKLVIAKQLACETAMWVN